MAQGNNSKNHHWWPVGLQKYVESLTDKENLKKETLKYLNTFKDHPYIFNLGHGVLPKTNPDMIEYLVKTVKDY